MDQYNYNNQNDQTSDNQGYTSGQQYAGQPNKQPQQTNVLAIVGMIFGIISILAACCGWYSVILGVPGLVCSILSRKQGKSGMAVAGIVCSIIGIIIGVLMTVMAYVLIGILMADPTYRELFQQYGM